MNRKNELYTVKKAKQHMTDKQVEEILTEFSGRTVRITSPAAMTQALEALDMEYRVNKVKPPKPNPEKWWYECSIFKGGGTVAYCCAYKYGKTVGYAVAKYLWERKKK